MKEAILGRLLEANEAGRPVVLATRIDTGEQEILSPLEPGTEASSWPMDTARQALLSDTTLLQEPEEGAGPVLLRPYNPRPRLVVIGAVHVAQHLVPLADAVGYDTTVIDPREAFAREFRFPGVALLTQWPDEALPELGLDHRSAVVVLTHDPKLDDPAIRVAVTTPAFYIGVLGSRKTHAARVERLRERGLGEAALDRLHAPIGLPIGARTPSEIALAVMAEVVQALRAPRE